MNKFEFTDNKGNTYHRISKAAARRLYESGFPVLWVPCKCSPTNDNWGIQVSKSANDYYSFNTVYDNWRYYNHYAELGKYPAFYAQDKYYYHIDFADGSNSYYGFTTCEMVPGEITRWYARFRMEIVQVINGTVYFKANERKV